MFCLCCLTHDAEEYRDGDVNRGGDALCETLSSKRLERRRACETLMTSSLSMLPERYHLQPQPMECFCHSRLSSVVVKAK